MEIMYFGANILGNFTIRPNYCLRMQVNSFNNGNFVSMGNTSKDHVFFINTNQTASAPYGLKFLSGNAYMFGGSSTGTGPVTFSTAGSVHVVGLDNHGEVDFTNSQDVWLSGTWCSSVGVHLLIALTHITNKNHNIHSPTIRSEHHRYDESARRPSGIRWRRWQRIRSHQSRYCDHRERKFQHYAGFELRFDYHQRSEHGGESGGRDEQRQYHCERRCV